MPNWVTNKVRLTGNKKDVESFKEKHFTIDEDKEKQFDFETIIPMPKNIFRGNLGQEERNLYGNNNWYDWSIENWGTKWNSRNCCIYDTFNSKDNSELNFSFDTAWSFPFQIFTELAKQYPNMEFEVEFADEDVGRNCGSVSIINGEMTFDDRDGDEDFAMDVLNIDREQEFYEQELSGME